MKRTNATFALNGLALGTQTGRVQRFSISQFRCGSTRLIFNFQKADDSFPRVRLLQEDDINNRKFRVKFKNRCL